MRIDESNYETFEKVHKITGTDYEIIWKDAENIEGVIDIDGLYAMIEDLICEVDRLNEEAKDREQDIADNYKRISMEEMI